MTSYDLDAIRDAARAPYALANLADCGSPDRGARADNANGAEYRGNWSAGAKFLAAVADDLADRLAEDDDETEISDLVAEVADGAPSIYTHEKWQQFVDLAAYNQDLDDLGGATGDMDKDASVALYIIAERLCWALLADAETGEAPDDDDDEMPNVRHTGSGDTCAACDQDGNDSAMRAWLHGGDHEEDDR